MEKAKQYRAAMLIAACSGKLTPQSSTEVEPQETARVLVDRSLAVRATRVPSRYLIPMSPIGTEDEVPTGWEAISLDQLCERVTSGSRDWSKYYDRGSGTFLMAQNVRPMRLDLAFRQVIDPPINSPDRARSQVEVGEVTSPEVCK